eukprot:gene15335-18178_t
MDKITTGIKTSLVCEKDFGSEHLVQQQLSRQHPAPKKTRADFDFIKTVGKGSYGKVKLVVEKETGKGFAAKILNKQLILKEKKTNDFGTAKVLGMDNRSRSGSFCGTAEYVCPELLVDRTAGKSADIWSFGCLLYQMTSGKLPFKGFNEYQTFQLIVKREFQFPPNFDPVLEDLINKLLALDPLERPLFDEIKAHPFFASVNWATIQTQEAPTIIAVSPPSPEGLLAAEDRQRSQSVGSPSVLAEKSKPRERSSTVQTPSSLNPSILSPPVPHNTAHSAKSPNACLVKIYVTPTDMLIGDSKERRKQLQEEQKDSVWNRFLLPDGEVIIAMTPIEKRTGLISKKRQLIITDSPRIFYIDPSKMIVKGEIPVDLTLVATSKSNKHFTLVSKGRTKHFYDLELESEKWVEYINDLKMLSKNVV